MKYYAIKKGRKPGIYTNWPEAQKQVAGFSGAAFKGFTSKKEAEEFLNSGSKKFDVKEAAITVYTDGGNRNTGNVKGGHVKSDDKAAWAYLILDGNKKIEGTDGEFGVTNNKMEITALVEALKKLLQLERSSEKIVVISDSRYLIDAIDSGWMKGWKARGWKKADGQIPANVELWIELDKLLTKFDNLQIIWTKGHATNAGNNRVDELLNETMNKMAK